MKALAIVVFMAVANAAFAAGDSDLGAANAEFEAGRYEQAAAGYEALLQSGPPSGELYFNLGNALERAGKPVEAALNYERSLILDPGLREARNNRALLAAASNVPLPPHRWQDDVVSFVHPQWLMIGGTVLGWAGIFGMAFLVFGEKRRPGVVAAGVLAFIAGSAIFGVGMVSDPRNADATLAMVTSPKGAQLLSEPTNNSSPLADLPAGSPLGVISPSGAWTYCALGSGAKGWVRTESLTPVEPGRKL